MIAVKVTPIMTATMAAMPTVARSSRKRGGGGLLGSGSSLGKISVTASQANPTPRTRAR